ncbi:MAG: S24 family peptidase [Cyanobacteria bacterium P01_H01_bin.15]
MNSINGTQSQSAFCAGIGDRLIQIRGCLTQKDFADTVGISVRTLRRYEIEDSYPNAAELAQICQIYGIDAAWLLLGLEAEMMQDKYQQVPHFNISASAGPGAFVEQEVVGSTMALDRRWLRYQLNVDPLSVSLIDVRGDSMFPTLLERDVLLVTNQVPQITDGLYVLRVDELLQVKRLIRKPGLKVFVTSDNPHYGSYEIDLEKPSPDFQIVGKVAWVGRKVNG